MTVNKLQLPAKENAVQLKINEIIDNLGGSGANTDLSNLTSTGEAHFQAPLVSGSNIKTINNTSILGSGDISISDVFLATYGITTWQDVYNALNNDKFVYCIEYSGNSPIYYTLCQNSSLDTSTEFYFSNINNGVETYISLHFLNNTWSKITRALETTSNKVTSISSSSTDTQYPSAKCVWDNCLHSVSYNSSTQTLTIS